MLEVADCHATSISRKVRAELGGCRRADLDGVQRKRFVSAKGAAKDLHRLVRYMSPYERVWFVAQYSRAREQRLCARELNRLCQDWI